ncbi:hypothetical protein GCM10009740_16040 [Terrabacter terrae]|uniref:Uncharacterized protein n=1 Tax=Terrabacter terrae TaxID=318434 RepID=A0ABN2U1H3_9MICO
MTTAGIPAHALLPLALLLVGAAALAASLAFRLARPTQRRAGWLAVGAPLIPAVRPHLAHDGADLTTVVIASLLLFVAVMHAQRTRIAQLPLLWGWQVDRAAGRLAFGTPETRGAAGIGPRPSWYSWVRRWRRISD